MYIPIWLIVIAVVIYFLWFRKNKKRNPSQNANSKFVGRHQQFYSVKKFLGQDIPDMELQIAINKDEDERKELAEMDLNLRGAGDLLGAKQWGISDLAMHALRNIKLVEYAREEAKSIIATDPQLESHIVLKKHIEELAKAPHLE